MSRPSAHLTWAELACHDGTEYPEAWRKERLPDLVFAFETLRKACGGKPLTVRSAYRTAAYNAQIGGAKDSQHVQGRALDLAPPEGMHVVDFWQMVAALAKAGKIPVHGIGYAPPSQGGYVHIDTRPGPGLAQWRYPLT